MVQINKIIDIVKEANNIVLDIYNCNDLNTTFKKDKSPLTLADTKASDYICDQLNKYYPNIPIICEETKQVPYEERKNWKEFWLVDPLDGTKEFIKRNGEFTVNIGLVRDNEPVLGVVGVPCQNLIYYSKKGNGAFCYNLLENTQKELNCFGFHLESPITFVSSRSHSNEDTEKFMDNFKIYDKISVGSSLKFMYLCENKAQIYPRFVPTMEWDTCAADAILREAGGTVELLNESPLVYNKKNLKNDYFIAYGRIKSS